jgi:outer membrane receptor protein involved in Fe transport
LKDLPLIQKLSVEGAGRLGHYSTVGGANQYRVSAEWAPVRDITFRGSQGTAVRAPNIVELYATPSLTIVSGNNAPDPCDRIIFGIATPAQQALRRVTCAAFIPNYNPATFVSNVGPGRAGGVSLLQGGNPNLSAETAHVFSLGGVVKPRWVPELQISLDWFKYNINHGITAVPPTTLVQQLCYESSQAPATNPFCAQIVRDPTGATTGVVGGVIRIDDGQLNVSKIKVEGWDGSIAYSFHTADHFGADYGNLNLKVDATWTYRWALQGFPGQAYAQLANTITNGTPEWKGQGSLEWARSNLRLQWTVHYLGSMISTTSFTAAQLTPYRTGA